MNNDINVTRTAEALERKYNFAKMLGATKNAESNSENIVKLNNELNNMLNSLIINLGDILDSQSDISLWFYDHLPTKTNEPYIDWASPSDHEGDLFYCQLNGYVYKYTSDGWEVQEDSNLVSALALTNADIDVSEDHERKVYFATPTPPYSSGDWWILEDGTLKICQLGKDSTGEYDTNDFVVSSKYTTTVATKQGDTITVLQGTVTTITENYVKYTDLSTGGSTTIAGENITTGNIKSSNYVSGTSGTNINLTDGKISTKNVVIDDDGMKLSNGAKVVGTNGLMNTYVYEKEQILGYARDYTYNSLTGNYDHIATDSLLIDFIIPSGLSITSAKVRLIHSPAEWINYDSSGTQYVVGYGRTPNIKLAKATNLYSRLCIASLNSEVWSQANSTTYSEISNAFGSSGWTPSTPSSTVHNSETKDSIDIKSYVSTGLNQLKIYPPDATQTWSDSQMASNSGYVYAIVQIDGYMTYS